MSSRNPSEIARKLRTLAEQIEYVGRDSAVLAVGSEFRLEEMLASLQGALALHFRVLSTESIARSVAAALHVPIAEMRSKTRRHHVAFARQVAMYLARELAVRSFPAIGAYFGRDHSTTMHAHKLVARRVAGDAAFALTINALKASLGEVQQEAAA